jgi:hypothetical protein
VASVERPAIIDALTDHDSPRPYPWLTAAQKARVLREVALYFTLLDNLRPIDQCRIATSTPEEKYAMSLSSCIAYRDDGTRCRAPATILDWQRGGLVCRDHVPLEVRAAQSQAEAYGSAHANLEHQGQRYTWRLRWDDANGQRLLRRLEDQP